MYNCVEKRLLGGECCGANALTGAKDVKNNKYHVFIIRKQLKL
jgi:hypothetical protein